MDVTAVLTHELGHIFGFDQGVHTAWVPGVTDGCTMALNSDTHVINPQVCQTEVELVYQLYGYSPVTDASFWGYPIATRVDAPDSVVVPYQGSATISYSHLRFDRSGGYASSAPLGGAHLVDSVSRVNIIDISPLGVVTVHGSPSLPDTVTIFGRLAGVPSNYRTATLATLRGQPIHVRLEGPPPNQPPAAGFRVSAINALPTPFTSTDTRQLTATVVNGGYPVTIQWQASYSDNSRYNIPPTSFQAGPFYLPVHAGSYTITVTATPKSTYTGTIGAALNGQFPVCTSGGAGGGLSAPVNLSGAAKPDVVGGC